MASEDNGFFATQIAQKGTDDPEQQQADSPKISKNVQKEENDKSLKNLLMAFNSYDKKQRGIIEINEAKEIFKQKNVSVQKFDVYYQICLPTHSGYVAFDEFLFIITLCEDESTDIQTKYEQCIKVDPRLVQFLRLLNNYRKKTEFEQNYKEAKKSKSKIEQIRERELERKRNYLTILHDHEMSQLEQKQKTHFVQFCDTWDQFMMDYEKTAADLLEKLQSKHDAEMSEFAERTREELASKVHFSKFIIELSAKQKNLARLQEYEKANAIHKEIEQLKLEQLHRKQRTDEESLQIRCAALKKQQISAINSLLQNIQKDRNDQMKQRKIDSQKMIVRNKSLISEINHRHMQSIKKAYQALHNLILDNQRVKAHQKYSK